MAAHAQNEYNEGDNEDEGCDNDGNELEAHGAVREAALVRTHVVAHLVWVALEAPDACTARKLAVRHEAADALLWHSSSNCRQTLMSVWVEKEKWDGSQTTCSVVLSSDRCRNEREDAKRSKYNGSNQRSLHPHWGRRCRKREWKEKKRREKTEAFNLSHTKKRGGKKEGKKSLKMVAEYATP